jgi:hypothetical protein
MVLAYSQNARTGVIKSPDGRSFHFTGSEWLSDELPQPEMPVVFLPREIWALNISRCGY